jgi:hypothetical protein
MILNASGACVDTNKLYGTSSIGTTTIARGASQDATCTAVTANEAQNKYLRWEGVVESEGSCKKANIGKAPVN